MEQLRFTWPDRYEQPAAFWSWVDDGIVKQASLGAHSIDLNWPWFRPWSLV